jgi:hypothetical protein
VKIDKYLDALRDDVMAIGGFKVVGKQFYTKRNPEAAGRALADKLNAERRERLTYEQKRFIIRRAREMRGFSAALCFTCDDTGFDRPRALNPEDEKAKRERELIETVKRAEQLAEDLRRMTQPQLHAIGGGKG